MKQSSRSKFRSRRKKLQIITGNNSGIQTPIDDKHELNGQNILKISLKNRLISENKKFNVRRLNKTEESANVSKEKDHHKTRQINFKLQKLLLNKHIDRQQQVGKQTTNTQIQKLKNLAQTLDLRRNKFKSLRIETQDQSLGNKKEKSPYLSKYKFRTAESHNQTNQTQQDQPLDKIKKYFYLTKLQQQEIQKYQVYFTGQRRVSSIKQFTDNEGNAKISNGDSIMYRYQIKASLGQGSFGQVFKAFDHKKKQQVALKIIKNHPKFNRQAKVEIKILQQVLMHDSKSHYNIVKLKHAFFFRGHACLVFELLQMNLYQFLRLNHFKGLSIDLIRRIAIQMLQALLFFQRFGIVHCDLKPQNILLKHQNKTGIKIIDVGSGTFQSEQIYTYIQSRFYRAPQIILGIRYSNKIDIWSFGCVLCELYTGYPLFPGENEQQQIQMLMQTLGPPPRVLIDRGSRSNKFFNDYDPKITSNSKGKIRYPNSKPLLKKLKGCQDSKFIQFLQRCFKWIPQERIKPDQALLDEWILQGLPIELRQQHIEIVKTQQGQLSK